MNLALSTLGTPTENEQVTTLRSSCGRPPVQAVTGNGSCSNVSSQNSRPSIVWRDSSRDAGSGVIDIVPVTIGFVRLEPVGVTLTLNVWFAVAPWASVIDGA